MQNWGPRACKLVRDYKINLAWRLLEVTFMYYRTSTDLMTDWQYETLENGLKRLNENSYDSFAILECGGWGRTRHCFLRVEEKHRRGKIKDRLPIDKPLFELVKEN